MMRRFNSLRIINQFFCLIALCTAMLSSQHVAANENDSAIAIEIMQFNQLPIASGNFIQRKYFTVLKQPIKSKGEVFFDVDLGLLWQTNQPLYSALILKNNRLFTQDSNSVIKELKGASDLSVMLLSIMSGNNTKITENFTTVKHSRAGCINLIPNLTQLAKVMQKIELCQSNKSENEISGVEDSILYEQIVLHEHSGNRTEIDLQLTSIVTLPEAIRARLQ